MPKKLGASWPPLQHLSIAFEGTHGRQIGAPICIRESRVRVRVGDVQLDDEEPCYNVHQGVNAAAADTGESISAILGA